MKKIGLATFTDDNFGTLLQAFALQQSIEACDYDVEIINYHRNMKTMAKESRLRKIFRHNPWFIIKYLNGYSATRLIKQAFSDFRSQRLHLSKEAYYRDSDTGKLQNKYDAFVCGSDMMWSSDFQKDWPFFYLGFADKAKCTAYAPSFGRNFLTSEQINEVSPLINDIGHLSCREEKGVELIRSKFGLEVTHAIDPTLLLKSSQWNTFVNNSARLIEDSYVLNYTFLHTNKNGRDKIYSQIIGKCNMKFVTLRGTGRQVSKFQYKKYAGPMEFVQLYRDADFVITDTFHGMLFAIIFNKPFVVLEKEPFGVSADRLISTLETLGIRDRYIKNDTILTDKFFCLDYTDVNMKLDALRSISIEYLKNSLRESTAQ